MKIKYCLVILLFLVLCKNLFAIGDDSTQHKFDPNWTQYYTYEYDRSYLRTVDTGILKFEWYNPSLQEHYYRQSGNLGYPAFLVNPYIGYNSNFDIGIHAYDPYLFNFDENKFYDTRNPYTELNYLLGAGNEQLFSGTHTQNIGKNYNWGFNFLRIGSQGNYKRQRADYFNINLFQSFTTKNEKYHIGFSTFSNKAKVQLNGGIPISIDSIYSSNNFASSDLLEVNLDSALYQFRQKNITVNHSYSFGKYYDKKTYDTLKEKNLVPFFTITHQIDFNTNNHIFSDDRRDFTFYPSVLNDTLKTRDSITYTMLSNKLSFKLTGDKPFNDSTYEYRRIQSEVFIQHRIYNFNSRYIDINELNTGITIRNGFANYYNKISSRVLSKLYQNLNWFGTVQYSLIDYNKSDYYLLANVGNKILGLPYYITYINRRYHANLIQNEFYSNHYEWKNNFDQQSISSFEVSATPYKENFRFSYRRSNYSNFIYFNNEAKPTQFIGVIKSTYYNLLINLKLRKLHIDNQFVWQQFDNDIFAFPKFYCFNSLYYNGNVFKNALQLKAGINVNYNQAYYTPDFNVVNSQFFLQNRIETGDYIWMDAFINMKIRTVRLSFIMNNVLQNIFDKGVFAVPNYPLQNRSIKLNVSWMFWN
jgi:hypothetical protein